MSGPRVLLLVPDGIGLRTFLCSSFPAAVHELGGRLDVWHPLPADVVAEHQEALGPEVGFHGLPVRREPVVARVLRTGKRFAPLYAERDAGTEKLLVDRSSTAVGHVVHWGGVVVGRTLAAVPSALPVVERAHARAAVGGDDPWTAQLQQLRPDVVLCTHQRAGLAVPPVVAARRLGIPTATFVHSWDNLPKGRMAVHADHVLVWSEKMAADLRRYQPDLPPERTHVVGTPQLEPHVDPTLRRTRAEVLGGLGLDPDRPVVLFSGSDLTTSPRDEAYLDDVAAAVRELDGVQVLFRPSPADLSDRYDGVLARHPQVVRSQPAWHHDGGGWDQAVPTRADVALLAGVVAHSDLVVNLGSTMAMDFAVAGTPALFLRYDPGGISRRDWDVHEIYRLPHFASVHRTGAVGWVDRREDLAAQIGQALAHPDAHADGRRAWLELEVAQPLDQAGARCAQVLVDVARRSPTAAGSGGR